MSKNNYKSGAMAGLRRKDRKRIQARKNSEKGLVNLNVKLVIGCPDCGQADSMAKSEMIVGSNQTHVKCKSCGRVLHPHKRGVYQQGLTPPTVEERTT